MQTEQESAAGAVERLKHELEQSQQQLADTYKMASIGRLVAGIIHEINTPIGSIRSNNDVVLPSLGKLHDMLSQLDTDSPQIRKALKIVETMRTLAEVDQIACERISGVIRNLKTFARGDRMDVAEVDLNENIEGALKLTQCEFRRRINVETDLGDLPRIECYPEKINQVLLNILINAGQAIEGEGTIRVQTRREGDWVRISISDTGQGIPPEHLPHLFQAGFTTKPAGVGTGLGLAISRKIITEKHGGTVEVESTVGKGTTFHIRLPIHRPPSVSTESPS
jgi:two-component system, NtrC family, sensor kinase